MCKGNLLYAGLLYAILSGVVCAQVDEIVARYPKGAIHTLQQATGALDEINHVRKIIEHSYQEGLKKCMTQFLVNMCVDELKEKRHNELLVLRPIEIEANVFLRKLKAQEKENTLKMKQEKINGVEGF